MVCVATWAGGGDVENLLLHELQLLLLFTQDLVDLGTELGGYIVLVVVFVRGGGRAAADGLWQGYGSRLELDGG